MKFPIDAVNRKRTASFIIVLSIVTIAPLWLLLAGVNPSAHAQTPDDPAMPTASASTTSSPADWTQFHRDNMQRWNPYETVLGVNNVGQLGLKWQSAPYGTEPGTYTTSSPAVVNGVVYFGSSDGSVHALNASTGATLWSYTIGGFTNSSPAVANGIVYVGSNDGNLYALNAGTGAKLWSYQTESDVLSGPAVVNGTVYLPSYDGTLYALDAGTGAKLWSYTVQPNGSLSSPAVANGVVYVGSEDAHVWALNATTGSKLWSYTTGGWVHSSPAVANGVVYIGSQDSNVYALNASTGATLWNYSTGNQVDFSSPAVANGVVYIGSQDGNVYALNANTGAKLWSFAAATVVESSPAVANGVVYIGADGGSGGGTVFALNATTGTELWSKQWSSTTGFFVDTSPSVVNGMVYIGAGYQMYAFGLGGASADLFLRIQPNPTTVHQGDLLTYAFPVWNLGPNNAVLEVLNTQVPAGTVFDYVRISGTPGLGTCTTPPYQGTGKIICHENGAMAPNTTWTVRLTVKVTAPAGTVITENAATLADSPDPNAANNMATVSLKVQ